MWRHPLVILALLLGGAWWLVGSSSTEAVLAVDGSLSYPGYRLSSVEPFAIEARVLSRHNYSLGRESDLSPTDLGIGWGPMARDEVISAFAFSQRNRWLYWKTERFPIPERDVQTYATNVHIIPASAAAAADLNRVREGDRIRLAGNLVDVAAEDGWRWRTSRSLTDTGNGACELLLLERIDWL